MIATIPARRSGSFKNGASGLVVAFHGGSIMHGSTGPVKCRPHVRNRRIVVVRELDGGSSPVHDDPMKRYEIWGNEQSALMVTNVDGQDVLKLLDDGFHQLQCFDAVDDAAAQKHLDDFLSKRPNVENTAKPEFPLGKMIEELINRNIMNVTNEPDDDWWQRFLDVTNHVRRQRGETELTGDDLMGAGVRWEPCGCGSPTCRGGKIEIVKDT